MGLGDFFNKAWNWVADKAKKVVTTVKDAANTVWQKAKDLGKKVAEVTKSVGKKAVEIVKKGAEKAEEAVKVVYTDVVQKPLGAIEEEVKNISKGFSSPLTWVALAVGAVVVIPAVLNARAGR